MTLNPSQIRALAASQIRIDLRNPKTGETRSSRVVLTVISYAFSALVLALALAEREATFAEILFASHSFAIVLGAFAIAGSYDDLMGRPREHAQALLLPVSEHTLYVARLLNIGLFGLVVAASAAFPLALLSGWQYGLAAGLVIGGSLVLMIGMVMLIVLAVVWLLTLYAPLRVQRTALSATRAALIGALVLCFQIVATQEMIVVLAAWWPPSWAVEVMVLGETRALLPMALVLVSMGILYLGLFPDCYRRILDRSAAIEAMRHAGSAQGAAPNRFERIFARDPHQQAGYGLLAAGLRADRIIRGRVWPALMLAGVFGAFAWWTGGLGDLFVHGAENILFDPAVQMHLSVLTVLLFASQAATQGVKVSDYWEASWVYGVLPVGSRRSLLVGAQQAIVLRVILPVCVVLGLLLSLSMSLFHAALHAGFWFAACAVITRIQVLMHRSPPLANSSDRFSAGERFIPLLMAIPAALVLLMLQTVFFASLPSAVIGIAGMLVLHSALGQPAPVPRRRPVAAHGALRPAVATVRD